MPQHHAGSKFRSHSAPHGTNTWFTKQGPSRTAQLARPIPTDIAAPQPVKPALVPSSQTKLSDVLNRDTKTGKIKSVEGAQVHHVVSDKRKFTKEHPLWELAGMNPNDPVNKMLLPTKKGAEELWTGT